MSSRVGCRFSKLLLHILYRNLWFRSILNCQLWNDWYIWKQWAWALLMIFVITSVMGSLVFRCLLWCHNMISTCDHYDHHCNKVVSWWRYHSMHVLSMNLILGDLVPWWLNKWCDLNYYTFILQLMDELYDNFRFKLDW